jgi:hypothetical protein
MVAVELDGNYIDAEPLKTRAAQSLTEAYKTIHARWKATQVICPNWHILDNEAPEELKQAIRENGCHAELSLLQRISTDEISQNEQFKHSRGISFQS